MKIKSKIQKRSKIKAITLNQDNQEGTRMLKAIMIFGLVLTGLVLLPTVNFLGQLLLLKVVALLGIM